MRSILPMLAGVAMPTPKASAFSVSDLIARGGTATEPAEAEAINEEVAAAMAPKTPKFRARYTAPDVEDVIPLALDLLRRPKLMRSATPDLKDRTGVKSEKRLRLDATIEVMGALNKVPMQTDPSTAAKLLWTIAETIECKIEMLMQIKSKYYLRPCDQLENRYLLKLRQRRMQPVISRMHKKGTMEENAKKKGRKVNKTATKAVVGASLELIKAKRNQKPEVRQAARDAALREVKERAKTKQAAKKVEKKVAAPTKAAAPKQSKAATKSQGKAPSKGRR